MSEEASGQSEPVNAILLGAGLFVQDGWIPALNGIQDTICIHGVHSRTQASADHAASLFDYQVPALTDLDEVLEREDVEALLLVLPIHVQPEILRRLLATGKHVVSEKPVAPDSPVARELIGLRREKQVWMVAENFVHKPCYIEAAAMLKDGIIGRPVVASWLSHIKMAKEDRYYSTEWRRSGVYKGGYVLDTGVHHVAVLRLLLGEVTGVQSTLRHFREDLAPPDSALINLEFENGAVAHQTFCFSETEGWTSGLIVQGETGRMTILPEEIKIQDGTGERSVAVDYSFGIAEELRVFANAVRGNGVCYTPEEALRDLQVMEQVLA